MRAYALMFGFYEGAKCIMYKYDPNTSQVFSALYGAGGLPTAMTRFDGVSASNRWDHLGKLLGVLHKSSGGTDWTPVAGFEWTVAGRLLSASNTFARINWDYDNAGREIGEAVTIGNTGYSPINSWTVARSLDLSGIETNTLFSLPDAQISIGRTLDAGGRVAALSGPAGETHVAAYCDWNGRLASVSGPVLMEAYDYDILDRPTNITYRTAAGDLLYAFSFLYEPDGLITQKITRLYGEAAGSAVTNSYTYDGMGRLIAADGEAYGYDLAGNRTSVSFASSAVSSTYTHNRLDGLLHDAAGNVTNYTRGDVAYSLACGGIGVVFIH